MDHEGLLVAEPQSRKGHLAGFGIELERRPAWGALDARRAFDRLPVSAYYEGN